MKTEIQRIIEYNVTAGRGYDKIEVPEHFVERGLQAVLGFQESMYALREAEFKVRKYADRAIEHGQEVAKVIGETARAFGEKAIEAAKPQIEKVRDFSEEMARKLRGKVADRVADILRGKPKD